VAHLLPQSRAVEKLEHDVGIAVVLAGIEDRDQVRVVEGAHGFRFLLEAPQPIGIGGGVRGQDLDGDLAPEPVVARAVDLPHPARAQGSQDFVRSQADSGAESGSMGGSTRGRQLPASVRVETGGSTRKVMRTRPRRISSPSDNGEGESSRRPRR